MRKSFTVVAVFMVFLCFSYVKAQTIQFDLADPQPDLIDVYAGSFATGDIEGDGDIDLLMAGLDPGRETALYLNDGTGNFTEVSDTPFPDASVTTSIFVDLDGDEDLDLFFSGMGFMIQEFAHIYLNDGEGNFTFLANPALPQFQGKGADIADVDGDGDRDIFISAANADGDIITDIFLNDGNALFSAAGNTSITPMENASVKFIDVENDGDWDIILSGLLENESSAIELFLNDGAGNFTADMNNNFIPLNADDIESSDIDNDGDSDLLITGAGDPFQAITALYLNNGSGLYTELEDTGIQNVFGGAVAIADFDNDGDQDILTIGSQDGGLPNIYNIVYENVGNTTFTPVDTLGSEYIADCVVEDFNGDGLQDVIIQGFVDNTNVWWNASILTSLDEKPKNTFKLYPNPVQENFIIEPDYFIAGQIFSIYDHTGRMVHSGTVNTKQMQFSVQDLSGGVYIFQLENGRATRFMKVSP